ncbi:purA [Wigglesworthia glossinidia endosymbiont of Glossina brevipalpis]|uniref:Adenylosuccinate synthetase n=1 Tax=Wigglesworthia glossinidia brevipalpis TaxID=36870 RepID=PURA_WIGBR|nr:RecName: Full=Adenylosuccinate synthetase; Short=AMPSase; Short=AdSS; AltName: Full=IMP--aspartate ligase [Wigglesworthia glossinidia endosymbiont of Glossina brevipalpis]BAC24325.1 purA [Wigglesworthia glossinidia endosymbiont of Glossina brevipalpis]
MKKNIIVLGAQWGDEGKGKVIDFLSKNINYVVRCQGGNNAGHTVVIKEEKTVLHLLPSSILNKNTINIISSGVVISPIDLVKEINMIEKKGISIKNRILISELCPLVLKYHVSMDVAREKNRKKKEIDSIGTTHRGIGPAYEDKIARRALRIHHLINKDKFKKKLKNIVEYYNFQLINYYKEQPVNHEKIFNELINKSKLLNNISIDIPSYLNSINKKNKSIIFEGAQGALLDIDYGTYPYVTSSNTTVGGIISSTGISPFSIKYILGIIKAYSTRVGNGPFPTEIFDETKNIILEKGKEFGSTTGRKRRIGWFDAVAVKRVIQINSFSGFCLTKIDVLDNIKEIKICTSYILPNGKILDNISNIDDWNKAKPIYKSMPGWLSKTKGVKNFKNLPILAKNYIKKLQSIIKIPIEIISTGSDRNDIIVLNKKLVE